MRIEKPFLFFYSYQDYLSNFYRCKITFDDNVFTTSEQLYMYFKAKYFNDAKMSKKILSAKTAFEAKKLGRKVKHFHVGDWDKVSPSIMYEVLRLKFNQNEKLKDKLIETGTLWLVEASPKDKLWGIGLECGSDNLLPSDTRATLPTKWQGKNRLGNLLMVLRANYQNDNLSKIYMDTQLTNTN